MSIFILMTDLLHHTKQLKVPVYTEEPYMTS